MVHDGSDASNLLDLQRENIDDYRNLTAEQKTELINDLIEDRDSRSMGRRLSQRSRTQDINNVIEQLIDIILGAKARSGIDGFFCLFPNSVEFHMAPRWFFTLEQIETFLCHNVKGWDTNKIEFLRTSKAQADWLKAEIRRLINKMLVDITGNEKAVMNYVSYERDIVLLYGIELVGWTMDKWANPSDLSNSIPPLQKLYSALESGQCHFVRVGMTDLNERRKAYDAKVAAGLVPPRKTRKDAGTKRAPRVEVSKKRRAVEDEDGGGDISQASKHHRGGGSVTTPEVQEIPGQHGPPVELEVPQQFEQSFFDTNAAALRTIQLYMQQQINHSQLQVPPNP
ncbi:hypothetical protein A0H81_14083 [Grifola frondosa]|uniref:Uncharacterized protein n=1 Tax=Grifola frondosa TaxID=5627 RepID=A0A1C7LMG0_GRIFR|nr:hypothetical protein A0H81_14083 [Grifola frondosa]